MSFYPVALSSSSPTKNLGQFRAHYIGHPLTQRFLEKSHSLAQFATLPEVVPSSFTTPNFLHSITKQNEHSRVTALDLKLLLMKAEEGNFIKSFDKALTWNTQIPFITAVQRRTRRF